jgi:tetratricopeptide (TPR) repeat protein
MSSKRRKKSKQHFKEDTKRSKSKKSSANKDNIPANSKNPDKDKQTKELPRRQITGRRLWLFRIVALTVIPVLLLVLLDLGLRIGGYGFPAGAMIQYKENGKVFYCDNVKFCWRFFPKIIAREFNPFRIPADKPKNTYRIFVLGASAAQGEPDGAFGFGRILQLMLKDMYPETNFEVVIAATAAINSHVVLEIAKDCSQHEPDLFVVYLGNNEVTGPYGAGTVFAPLSGSLSLIRMGIAFKATKLGQLLSNFAEWAGAQNKRPTVWRGLEMFLKKQIRVNDEQLETVYQHFKSNLQDIIRVGRDHGAKIIICTVGSNLKDNPPFASLHRLNLSDAEKKSWDELYNQAVTFEADKNYSEAIEQYLAASKIDTCYADLQFRLGRCYWALGDYASAKQRYINACELDTLRFRADSQINEIIRSVVTSQAEKGVYLADAVSTFEANSPNGIAGNELFYEHVHLNFKGNYLLARTVFEQAQKLLDQRITNHKADDSSPLTEAECAQRLAYTQWDQYVIADEVLKRFIVKPPFTNQLYHEEQVEMMEQQCKALKADLTPEALEKSAAQYRQAIQDAPQDLYMRWKYGRLLAEDLKDYRAAAEQFQFVQRNIPHSYVMYNTLGSIYRITGNIDAAVYNYNKAIQIKPTCGDAHYYLGTIYQQQGDTKKAIKHYSKAIHLLPNYVLAYNSLADVFYKQGKIDKAVEVCRRGVTSVPDSSLLHCSLSLLVYKQGHTEEAIKELRTAVKLDPNNTQARQVLSDMLKKSAN